jgi:hypothetical protein
MEITPIDLAAEYERAAHMWPVIAATERTYQLPPMMLFAIGARETNLRDVVGDGGHGHGIFQLDDRSHTIPDPFPVGMQATRAGAMMRSQIDHFHGNIRAALAAYNSGVGTVDWNLAHNLDVDKGTANGNYSADVYDRMIWLQKNYPPVTPTPKELNMDEATVRRIVTDCIEAFLHDNTGHQVSVDTLLAERLGPIARRVEDIDAKVTALTQRK